MGRRRAEARKQRLCRTPQTSSPVPATPIDDPVEQLIARARRARAQGDTRRSIVLLRQACALDEWRPRAWTLLGVHLARGGAAEEAARALKQARWLRARAGEAARAAATERLATKLLRAAA
jgi:Flp pilus assembly protein TadD